MKRAVLLAATGLGLAGVASADMAEIKASGVLRVLAVVVEKEPEFVSRRSPPGFDVEVLEGFARLHRLRVRLVPEEGWDLLLPALLEGRGDVVAGRFTATDARRKQATFTTEVFPIRNVVVNRRPHPPVLTLAALLKQRVGIVKGTSMADFLGAAGLDPGQLDDTTPPGGMEAALRAGRFDCTVDEIASAIAAQRRDPDLQLGLFLGPPASYAYAVRPADVELLKVLNGYVGALRRTPTWNRLVVKYFGEAAPEVLRRARE